MIPFIKKYLIDNWTNLDLGETPSDLLFVKFEDRLIRDAEVAVVTFLVNKVAQGKAEPVLILRFPRYPNSLASQSLELEYKQLSYIHQNLKQVEIKKLVPKPVLWQEINTNNVLAISFLPGKSLGQQIISKDILKSYIDNYGLAFRWLVIFQHDLGAQGSVSGPELLSRVVKQYNQAFPQNVAARKSYYEKLQAKAQELSGLSIPIFAQHGDFHAENIFVVDQNIAGVIDWEDLQQNGVPGFDLFHFIKTYFEALFDYFAQTKNITSIEQLSSAEAVLKIVKGTVENYFQSMALDPKLIPLLLPLYLIQSAIIAGCLRKKALAALGKYDVLLKLETMTIDDLLQNMSIFAYSNVSKKATSEGNKDQAELCEKKIQTILAKVK